MINKFNLMKTTPYKHQAEEFEKYRNHKARMLLWGMRTGKSKACIDLACNLYLKDEIDSVLIIAPNGVHSNWAINEIPLHSWGSTEYEIFVWNSALTTNISWQNKFMDFIAPSKIMRCGIRKTLKWFSVNSDGLRAEKSRRAISAFVASNPRFLLIVDESHDFRSPMSKRTQAARGLSKYAKYIRCLTGTSVTNSPLHAYSQYELLSPNALGFKTYKAFKEKYAVYETRRIGSRNIKVILEYINLEDLRKRISNWSSVVLREDIKDMPPLVYTDEIIHLPKKLNDMYTSMENKWASDFDFNEEFLDIEEMEIPTRRIKLRQIVSGFLKGKDDTIIKYENPRLKRLEELLISFNKDNLSPIIWCAFIHDIEEITKLCAKLNLRFVTYYGEMSSPERIKALESFQNSKAKTVFIGQPAAGGVGLNLSKADVVVWYSHIENGIIKSQADERATRIGKRSIDIIHFRTPGSLDDLILDAWRRNISLADYISGHGLKNLLNKRMKL